MTEQSLLSCLLQLRRQSVIVILGCFLVEWVPHARFIESSRKRSHKGCRELAWSVIEPYNALWLLLELKLAFLGQKIHDQTTHATVGAG